MVVEELGPFNGLVVVVGEPGGRKERLVESPGHARRVWLLARIKKNSSGGLWDLQNAVALGEDAWLAENSGTCSERLGTGCIMGQDGIDYDDSVEDISIRVHSED